MRRITSKDIRDAVEKGIQDLVRMAGQPPVPDDVIYDLLRLLLTETFDRLSCGEEVMSVEFRRSDILEWKNESLLRLMEFKRKVG
jgi:hypothetical protein